MNPQAFYEQVLAGSEMSPDQRHRHFTKLHTSVLDDYLRAVRFTVTDLAEQPAPNTDDPRSLKIIVAHIAEWDRFAIAAACDILTGLQEPRMVNNFAGYVDEHGVQHDFESVNSFNAYQEARYADADWLDVQRMAIELAETLFALFTTRKLLNGPRLEDTATFARPNA